MAQIWLPNWSPPSSHHEKLGKRWLFARHVCPISSKIHHDGSQIRLSPLWTIPILSGWWFQSLWKILVSWGYYSQYMEKQMFQTTNQLYFTSPCRFDRSFFQEKQNCFVPIRPIHRKKHGKCCQSAGRCPTVRNPTKSNPFDMSWYIYYLTSTQSMIVL